MPTATNEPQLSELKQQAIDWLVRLRSDDLSDSEMSAFADWLSEDYTHSNAFAAAENLFNDIVIVAKSPAISTKTQTKTNEPQQQTPASHASKQQLTQRKRRTRWMVSSLALAAMWLFAVILLFPQQMHLFDNFLSDYHTETGELREIKLADGSQLLLNTNSAVSINYTDSQRQIILHHGQASFTVAKDAQRPFEVVSDELIVRALGTVFEVYHSDANEISVTVQEHAVMARVQADTQANVKVQQGQQLRYRPGETLPQPTPVELNQITAWQKHRLFINDRPLSELITELDRYRVGRIFLSDDKLKNLRVTGVFTLDKPDDALKSVRKALALEETRLGSWWVLLHR